MSFYRPSSFNVLPPVVKNLVIINVIMYFATWFLEAKSGIDLKDILGMRMPGSESFQIYQVVTYMFMHGSLPHIFFNMLGLWMFGSTLEQIWGPKRFLTYYFVTGIGAAFIHYLVLYFEIQPALEQINEQLNNPNVTNYEYLVNLKYSLLNAPNVVGASGSLYGLLLAYGMILPNAMIFLYFFPIKAKYFVIIYGAMELFNGVSGSGSNIAHFAHLGGMLIGYIFLRIWGKHNFNNY